MYKNSTFVYLHLHACTSVIKFVPVCTRTVPPHIYITRVYFCDFCVHLSTCVYKNILPACTIYGNCVYFCVKVHAGTILSTCTRILKYTHTQKSVGFHASCTVVVVSCCNILLRIFAFHIAFISFNY